MKLVEIPGQIKAVWWGDANMHFDLSAGSPLSLESSFAYGVQWSSAERLATQVFESLGRRVTLPERHLSPLRILQLLRTINVLSGTNPRCEQLFEALLRIFRPLSLQIPPSN
jgi:hypothetical protein